MATVLLLLGCGGEDPLAPGILQIDGDWSLEETWANTGLGIRCETAGAITIEQADDIITGSLSQQGTCTDRSGATFPTGADGILRAGRVAGVRASFTAANCNYVASISGTPPSVLSGTVQCTLSSGGTTVRFIGTWRGTR